MKPQPRNGWTQNPKDECVICDDWWTRDDRVVSIVRYGDEYFVWIVCDGREGMLYTQVSDTGYPGLDLAIQLANSFWPRGFITINEGVVSGGS